jgi:hypothetical protein
MDESEYCAGLIETAPELGGIVFNSIELRLSLELGQLAGTDDGRQMPG